MFGLYCIGVRPRFGDVGAADLRSLLLHDVLLDALDQSLTTSCPMCSDCAYEPWCGADPVFHHTTMGDVIGHKAHSAFCARNTGVFELLLDRYENDPYCRDLFTLWANR